MDSVELDYLRAIELAISKNDTPAAFELSLGLQDYRENYKVRDYELFR